MQNKANKFRDLLTEDLGSALTYLRESFNPLPDNQESLDLLVADYKSWQREDLNRTRSYEWLDTERRSLTKRALGLIKLLEDREYHRPTYEEKRFHRLIDQALAEFSRLETEIPNERSIRFAAAPVLDGWINSYLDLAQREQLPSGYTEETISKQLDELLMRVKSWVHDFETTSNRITDAHPEIMKPIEPIVQLLEKHLSLGLPSNEIRFSNLIDKAGKLLPGFALESKIAQAFRNEILRLATTLMQSEFARLSTVIKMPNVQRLYRFTEQLTNYSKLLEPASNAAHQLFNGNMAFRKKLDEHKLSMMKSVFSGKNLVNNLKSQPE